MLLAKRTAAYLVDIIILFAILAPAGFLIQRWFAYQPNTGPEIARVILWNFSLPIWIYFTWSDRSPGGATPGKRLFKIRVTDLTGNRPGFGRALIRTAFKLLPWETVHVAAFALSTSPSIMVALQWAVLVLANLLAVLYFAVAIATRGRRSVHDYIARTEVCMN